MMYMTADLWGVGGGGLPSIVPKENVQCAVKRLLSFQLGPGIKKFGNAQLKRHF